MKDIKVLVISGISGAGKSTLGEGLRDHLESLGQKVKVLDGDMMRTFFDGELKYSSKDRLMVSKILAHVAFHLSSQGIFVILATMLSQPGAREFLGQKVKFKEIFLDAKLELCMKNDKKQIYKNALSLDKPNIVGHDLGFSKPQEADLVLKTHVESPEESLKKIIYYLSSNNLFGLTLKN